MKFTMIFPFLAALMVATYGYYEEQHGPAHYNFAYGVDDHHTGDHHQQHEERDGHVVRGSYSLKEADGTTRLVEYVAGPHSGFNAVVKRIGHAQHPQHYKRYAGEGSWGQQQRGLDGEGAWGWGGQNGYWGGYGGESRVGTTHWGFNY